MTDFFANLAQGLRLVLGRPLRPVRWRPRASTYLSMGLACFFLVGLVDYVAIGEGARFNPFAAMSLATLVSCWLTLSLLLSISARAFEKLPALLTAASVVFFWYVLFSSLALVYYRQSVADFPASLPGWLVSYCVALGLGVLKTAYGDVRWRSYGLLILGVVGINLLNSYWYLFPSLFYAPQEQDYPHVVQVDEEAVYFRQPTLMSLKADALAQGQPGVAEMYFLGFAGNGDEAVFGSEVRYVQEVVQSTYLADASYAFSLDSSVASLDSAPLASVYNLRAALETFAGKMNVDEDVLMLFLTSHGSRDASLDVSLASFELRDLYAQTLREALDEAGIQWRVIIVSACFSGSFVDALKNDNTIIVTAASAEKTSFGCSSDRELTYFGEALFKDALATETDFLRAVESARKLVTAREREEALEPSDPQLIVGAGMLRKLQAMGVTAP